MTTAVNAPSKNSILSAVHETASDLRRLGCIDSSKMEKLNAFCGDSSSEKWMTISREDFINAIQRITPQHKLKSFLLKEIQLTYSNGEATFSMGNSPLAKLKAQGQWFGVVSFPFSYAYSFTKFQPVNDPVKIEFDAGKIKIETTRIPASWQAQ